MHTKTKLAFQVFAYALLTACAAHSEGFNLGPAETRDSELGMVMTNKEGMTLYTFSKDAPGVSNCSGACANAWPPFAASEDAEGSGKFTVITRVDGTRQWAYEGKPLYTWQGDRVPGDVTGHEMNNVWFAVEIEESGSRKSGSYGSGGY